MVNNQTAVDWLIERLTNRQNGVFDGFPIMSLDEIYEQAKAMEEEAKAMEEDKIKNVHLMWFNYFNATYRTILKRNI
jgi:hypothetical protein